MFAQPFGPKRRPLPRPGHDDGGGPRACDSRAHAGSGSAYRDPELLPDPHRQVFQSPAYDPMDRRHRTALDHRCQSLALGGVQLARMARRFCRALMKYRAGHGEERFSERSVEYCRRARAHLASLGSPLANSPLPSVLCVRYLSPLWGDPQHGARRDQHVEGWGRGSRNRARKEQTGLGRPRCPHEGNHRQGHLCLAPHRRWYLMEENLNTAIVPPHRGASQRPNALPPPNRDCVPTVTGLVCNGRPLARDHRLVCARWLRRRVLFHRSNP